MRTYLAAAIGILFAVPVSDAQQETGGPVGFTRLYSQFPAASNGNGADLTEDTFAAPTFTIPAGQLAAVGDTIHIVASGNLGATTDVKTVRLKINGTNMGAAIANTAAQTAWKIDTYISKTGSNAQLIVALGQSVSTGNSFTGAGSQTDTSPITVAVSGQNSTNPVANSITCTFLTVDFQH
jgi:hypothetical protein